MSRWMDKQNMVYAYNGKTSRLLEKEILIYSTIQMTLENIMLSKIKTHSTIPLI